MDIFLITLIALWINPILGFILAIITKKKDKLRSRLIIIFASITIIEIFSIFTEISKTIKSNYWDGFESPYRTHPNDVKDVEISGMIFRNILFDGTSFVMERTRVTGNVESILTSGSISASKENLSQYTLAT